MAALELLERTAKVDLMLIDLAMPGLSGAEIARRVQTTRPALPILCVPGYADRAALEGVSEAQIIGKPFVDTELHEKVRTALAGERRERSCACGPGGAKSLALTHAGSSVDVPALHDRGCRNQRANATLPAAFGAVRSADGGRGIAFGRVGLCAADGRMRVFGKTRHLRALLFCVLASSATPLCAQGAVQPFSHELVQQAASELAKKPYEAPATDAAKASKDLDYDQFRQIRFRRERTIWRGENLNFELQVLPTGWLFKTPIEINLVDVGNVRLLSPDNSYFDLGPLAGKLAPEARLGFSGFRLTGPLNRLDLFDEIIVFQGASYFRALSRGQIYGLSARGLALNVGKSEGEEFPLFRRFWIEKPPAGAAKIVIHALLDSPSVTGAYRFEVTPGWPTAMDVQTTLYPRRDLSDVGIAPMTSMFLFSPINRARISDFRPAVHDSDGLAILNGWGEHIWRPLNNPRRLQTSNFLDRNPKGFGLIQRLRTFAGFQDLEADYERRPSAWVEPREEWGGGAVELFEIPSEEEIHDNIVAYWKPAQTLTAGKAHSFNYKLTWPDDVPRSWPGAYVLATRAGLIAGPQRKAGVVQFVVDFKGFVSPSASELPFARVEASNGAPSAPVVQTNPEIDGLRVSFSFDPKGAAASELRLVLQTNDSPVSETWLYRWTKD